MFRRLLALLLLVVPAAYAVENIYVDSFTRNVVNLGAVNFATSQLKVNGIAVLGGGGGGGGGGGTIDNVRINLPIALFVSPVDYVISGGLAEGTATLAPQPTNTIFANLTGGSAAPIFVTLATVKTSLAIDNVNNTTDANKPISTATQAALDTLTSNVATNTSNISANTTAIAGKADTTTVNSALALKYDTSAATTALAGKEPALGNPSVDGYVLMSTTAGARSWTALAGGGGGGGTGTVTNFSAGNLPPLFITGVASSSSTPSLAFSLSSVAANTFFGNASAFSAPPAFMDATTARGALGGTTIGQNIFTLTNPAAIKFIRLNADNTASTRTASELRTDIGAGTVTSVSATNNVPSLIGISVTSAATAPVLMFDPVNAAGNTFYGNGTGSSAAPSFMSASAARLALGGTTVGQSMFQLANPSAITYPRISAANTVTAAAPSTVLSDIGAASITDSRFPANVTGIRKSAGSASTDTAATANVDYAKNGEMLTGSTGDTDGVWTPGATVWRQSAALTANRSGTLPSASSYASGTVITYIDSLTTGNFGRAFGRGGSDTLNGGTAPITSFIAGSYGFNGSKIVYFETNGLDAWRILGVGTVDHVEDTIDANKQFKFDASLQTPGTQGTVSAANGQSVTVLPTDSSIPGVWRDVDSQGVVTKIPVSPTELDTQEDVIGQASVTVSDSSHTVISDGTIDTIRIAGTLNGPYTIKWPSANQYGTNFHPGKTVTLVDASGSASTSNPVTVTSINGTDTFSGNSSFGFSDPNGRVELTSDGISGWTVPIGKTSVQPYAVITPNNNTFTIIADTSAEPNKGLLNLSSGANNLAVTNPYDGMRLDLILKQPASGGAATLNLPAVSRVASGGAGLVTLTATNGAIDELKGSYNGTLGTFLWETPILNYTSISVPAQPTGLTATPGAAGSNQINLAWTDAATTETGYQVQRANGLSGTPVTAIANLASNSTSYSDGSVMPSAGYTYNVRAFNSGGYSIASTNASATAPTGAPTADLWELHLNEGSLTTANATVPSGASATLSIANWTTSTQSGSGAAFAPVAGMLGATNLQVAPQGTPGTTTYYYKVLAFKNGGTHNTIVQQNTTTGAAILNGTNFNRITWNAVTGRDYYEVYRTASGGTPSSTGRLTGTGSGFTALTFDDTGVATNGSVPTITSSTDVSTVTKDLSIDYTKGGTLPGNVLSVSFWAKSTYAGATGNIIKLNSNTTISQVDGASHKFSISFNGASGTITGTVSNSVSRNNGSGSHPINSGADWHHIVVEMDNSSATNITSNGASDTIRVYYDGLATQETVTYTLQTRSGAAVFATGAPVIGSNLVSGSIDDVRIYGHLLTTTEIAALFTGNAQ